MKDKNDIELQRGDIIDIHQTVNGQNLFIVFNIIPCLDIRYNYDFNRKYEYNQEDLLIKPMFSFTDEPEWEIVGNIFK
jgi:hypothetical protein